MSLSLRPDSGSSSLRHSTLLQQIWQQTTEAGSLRHVLASLLAYLVLPNLLMRFVAHGLLGTWQPIDIDYALAAVVGGFMGLWPTVAATACALLIDAFITASAVYHLSPAGAALGLIELAAIRPWLLSALAIAAIALAIGLARIASVVAPPTSSPVRLSRVVLLLTVVALYAADLANGTAGFAQRSRVVVDWNVTGSGSWLLTSAAREELRFRSHRRRELSREPATSATAALFALMDSTKDQLPYSGVVLVLVESWGSFIDTNSTRRVIEPLLSPRVRARYVVRQGVTPFHGATSNGEFRELCGIDASYMDAPDKPMGRCLPERLRSEGFRTIAIHGFDPEFYRREQWYPVIGFDELLFKNAMRRISKDHLCGSLFSGVCDRDALTEVESQLRGGSAGERRFVYWVTLTTHFPLDERTTDPRELDCTSDSAAAHDDLICALMRLWHENMSRIARIADDDHLSSTRFIIVGDHSPPFTRAAERNLVRQDVVPFVDLIPRDSATRRNQLRR